MERAVAHRTVPRTGGYGESPAGLGAMTGAGGPRRQWAPRTSTPSNNAHWTRRGRRNGASPRRKRTDGSSRRRATTHRRRYETHSSTNPPTR
jgi:hypothetical protein